MPKRKRAKRTTKSASPSWTGLVVTFVVLVVATIACAWLMLFYLNHRPLDLEAHTVEAARMVEEALKAIGVREGAIERSAEELVTDATGRWRRFDFSMTLPPGLTYQGLQEKLTQALETRGVQVSPSDGVGTLALSLLGHEFARLRTREAPPEDARPTAVDGHEGTQQVEALTPELEPLTPHEGATRATAPSHEGGRDAVPYSPLTPSKPAPPAPVPTARLNLPEIDGPGSVSDAKSSPKAAIIVDDGGYGGAATEKILGLDPRLTFAILPGTPQATELANRAAQAGFQVILHMPMEAVGGGNGKLETLKPGMTPQDIEATTLRAMEDVPGIVGMNNHEGSAFTADIDGMTVFLKILQAHGLFFIDSLTSSRSVGGATARSLGVPTAARDVFLDNESDPAYIRGQFELLLDIAKAKGEAIGICHFRPDTAVVLEEILPRFAEEGVQLVHVSELVK